MVLRRLVPSALLNDSRVVLEGGSDESLPSGQVYVSPTSGKVYDGSRGDSLAQLPPDATEVKRTTWWVRLRWKKREGENPSQSFSQNERGKIIVLFDASGTLFDDSLLMQMALDETFDLYGVSFDRTTFEEKICLPFASFLAKMGIPACKVSAFNELFSSIYLEKIDHVKLFPDVRPCLDTLRNMGIRTGLVSATPKDLLLATVKSFGLEKSFELIISDALKPSPQPILQTCYAMAIEHLERVSYVGDMSEDVICAKRAGVNPIGICRVDGGYHKRTKLEAQRPSRIITDLRELFSITTEPCLCPNCGIEMRFCHSEYSIDLYVCPECGTRRFVTNRRWSECRSSS